MIVNCILRKNTEDQNSNLTKAYSRVDIEITLKGMHPTKEPEPDGTHALFYQKYCLKVLNGQENMEDLNKTLIVLIPKVNEPKV